jgi:rhamnogalacturonan endolyase
MHDVQYRAETARQQTTYNQPAYTSFYLASDMDFANVPILTTPVTPGEPKFKDRPGTEQDEVQVPNDRTGVDYYVDGELVTSANGKVSVVGDATVVAVPSPWYRIADGVTSEWTVSFDD